MGALHDAIRYGSEEKALKLIADGADLTERDAWKMAPLLVAAERGKVACVEKMLAAGASLRDRDRYRNSPLHLAVKGEHLAVIRLLLAAKAKVKVGNSWRSTPLHLATSVEVCRMLLDAGADINALDRDKKTALALAITGQHTERVRALLARGAKQEVPGCTDTLELAITDGQTDLVKLLIEAGASLNPSYGMPPLLWSVRIDKPAIFTLLLEHRAPITRRFAEDYELLQAAMLSKNPLYLETLMAGGIDRVSHTEYGWTPLYRAASSCSLAVVDRLLRDGIDADTENTDGMTPLSAACGNSAFAVEITERLIAAGADINHTPASGQTPIFTAEWSSPADSLPRFLALGADPMVADARGWTLAHRIAATNHPDNLDRLPMLDLDAVDHNGWTPLDCARRYAAASVVARLEARGAAQTFRGSLAWACRSGDLEALRTLIADGVDLEVPDRYWSRPLEMAIQYRQLAAATLLLEQGVAVEPMSVHEKTAHLPRGWGPMYRAAGNGSVEGLRMLHEAGASLSPPIPDPLVVVALRARSTPPIAWLIQAGAPLDDFDQQGWTALHHACDRKDLALVELLLDGGASPSLKTRTARDRAPAGMTGLQLLLRYATKVPGKLKKKLR